jgi:2-dehydro-3-deoxyglucarate aldolase
MPAVTPYQALPNRFRRAVCGGETQIGCWSSLASPIVTELLGIVGFDWMLLKDSASAPVVRPPANDSVFIKRLLDSGFSNFLVPFIESADDAARAVAATRYPPQGIRGVSVSHRGNHFATVPDYFDIANDNVCVIVQIESRKAVDAIDEILAVEGVDAVFVGPSDLAAGYGHLGNANHPDVQQAIAHVFERAKAAGKSSGILAPVQADADRYLSMGCRVIAVCADMGMLKGAAQAVQKHFMQKQAGTV